MKHFQTIAELYTVNGFPPPENPLLGLITFDDIKGCVFAHTEFTMGFYKIALKKIRSGTVMYGKTKYDHDNGSMFFLKPNQIISMSDLELTERGFMIYIDEDYLLGHPLHAMIKKYGYFDYEANEALHLSPKEEEIIWDVFNKIRHEYDNNQDDYSKDIMLAHIDSILKYAQRFYKRQFLNRSVLSGTVTSRFSEILKRYFESGNLEKHGLPTVAYMASQLSLSARYLSDLLRQETGKAALEHIHIALVNEAKNILMSTDKTVAETAYQLGFENPPYFSRLFKKEVGLTPTEYREQFLN
ncbi:helix-turn-helix transcriptional regulator [Mucilaginibacter rubeus]|uniref:AraC family transcriptional regulator n=1 Tax=Mucilaginibacter rubeus TaxID=2027860 RepID=A0AAE6JKP0_9SPHI|nr:MULTISPECIES: helix-turn-helix transcriptional regulator [Mucilaginibacter]QEM07178.1 helix-turn-helix transcriptional regulator [Mucilaginibacter rubeus]QEM19634.1 helix-turn-helix transcriptional regulator [Mucilaginibacter gossypii]QTE43672.1 AraC family transcriptional regulator [Mucilaginibacter rubeus]QTE50272.1 AraC family transcriptional regulator [Mucilaginibacter rubeus]QTE55359.1 AraC family transcriptional regulator [Mucilaginibacter rubeus]